LLKTDGKYTNSRKNKHSESAAFGKWRADVSHVSGVLAVFIHSQSLTLYSTIERYDRFVNNELRMWKEVVKA
jgi:hypothetical protein